MPGHFDGQSSRRPEYLLDLAGNSADDLFGARLGAGHGTPVIDFGPQLYRQQVSASLSAPIGLVCAGKEREPITFGHHEVRPCRHGSPGHPL